MTDSEFLLCIILFGSTFAGAGWSGWYLCEQFKNKEPSRETLEYLNKASRSSIVFILFGSITNCLGLYALLDFTNYLN